MKKKKKKKKQQQKKGESKDLCIMRLDDGFTGDFVMAHISLPR